MKFNPNRETKAARPGAAAGKSEQRKSMKMEADELTEKIKACVKEALEEQKADGDGEGEDEGAVEAAPADIAAIIEQAMDVVAEKRKSRKDAGEDLGEVTTDEVLEAVAEIIDATAEDEAKGDEDQQDEEAKEGEGEDEAKGRKAAPRPRQAKSKASSRPAPVQRKYASIYMSRGTSGGAAKKAVPPAIQLARAIKCLDVFGRHDPDMASFYARKKYDDAEMSREFKALSATNPAGGGYLIPEVYLADIVELLYAKTVIFELGAQKVPMANGNLNIPRMTSGARATWGGEGRKIAKSQPAFGNIKLSAKRLEAIVPQTRELLMSTDFSADQIFANDLTRRMELGLDYGSMFGKGGEFQPLGVFTDKEVEHLDAKTLGNVELASADGAITADFPVFVRSKVLAKNVDDAHLGWTFNSVLEGYLMNLKTTTGAYIYRDEMTGGKLLGFPYRVSNQITTADGGLTELAFGNWSDLLVGEQMGLETYTTLDGSWVDEAGVQHNAFEENLAATRALMYVDIAARHKESFIHVKNIKAF